MRNSGFIKKFKLLDVYPKSKDEVIQKSSAGAVVSVIGIFILLFLFVNEIIEFEAPDYKSILTVDSSREKKMNINIRILFLELPCEAISFDVSDRLGEERIDIGGNELSKIPFRGDFYKIRRLALVNGGWGTLSNVWNFENHLWKELTKNAIPSEELNSCPSCYDAQIHPGQCCRSCWSLKTAYAGAKMKQDLALAHLQCQVAEEQTEGCLVNAEINVNMIQGSFHIAVGSPHMHAGGHHHDWPKELRQVGFNISHYVSHLSFGKEFPGSSSPIDGMLMSPPEIGQQQYFLQVVPTTYKSNHKEIDTNQFSMTNHYSKIDMTEEHIELPGVFFKYDISPLKISIDNMNKPISHLLLRLCAVIGGVWVVIGIVYSSVTNMLGLVRTKKSQ